MTQGILIFAFNNSEIDYVSIAAYAAKQAKKFLNLPVSIVTNQSSYVQDKFSEVFDKVILFNDTSTQVKRFYNGSDSYKSAVWHNASRSNCYDFTPYDETLVIDSDFIINSDFLKYCWTQPNDFLIYDNSLDLASWRDTSEFDYISQYSIKFYWATVFFFRKNKKTELFFNLVEYIKNNWNYYQRLYQLPSLKFRNDHAFSIAINILGNDFVTTIPNKLAYITDRDYLLEHTDTKMKFLIQKKGLSDQYTAISTANMDMHVMSKYSLLQVIGNNNE
jgi:hypothetical protein